MASELDIAKARAACIVASIDYTDHYYYPRLKKSHKHVEKKKKYKTKLEQPVDYNDIIINHSKLPKAGIALFNEKIYKPVDLINKLKITHPIISKIPLELWGTIWISGLSVLNLIMDIDCRSENNNELEIWMYHKDRETTLEHLEKLKPIMLLASKPLRMAPDRIQWIYNGISVVLRLTSKPYTTPLDYFKFVNTFDVFECVYDGTSIYSSGGQIVSMMWGFGTVHKLPNSSNDTEINDIMLNEILHSVGLVGNISFNEFTRNQINYRQTICSSDLLSILKIGFKLTNLIVMILYVYKNLHKMSLFNGLYNTTIFGNVIICDRCNRRSDDECRHVYWNSNASDILHFNIIDNLKANIRYDNILNDKGEFQSEAFWNVVTSQYLANEINSTAIQLSIKKVKSSYNVEKNHFNGVNNSQFMKYYSIYTGYDFNELFEKFPMYIIKYYRYRFKDLNKLFRVDNEFGFGFIEMSSYKITPVQTKIIEEYNKTNSYGVVIPNGNIKSLQSYIVSMLIDNRCDEDLKVQLVAKKPIIQFIKSVLATEDLSLEDKTEQIKTENETIIAKICSKVRFSKEYIESHLDKNATLSSLAQNLELVTNSNGYKSSNIDIKIKVHIKILEIALNNMLLYCKNSIRHSINRLIFEALDVLNKIYSIDNIVKILKIIYMFKAKLIYHNCNLFYDMDKLFIKRYIDPVSLVEHITIYRYEV